MKKVILIFALSMLILQGCTSAKKNVVALPDEQVAEAPIATIEKEHELKANELHIVWPAEWKPKVFFDFDNDEVSMYTARALGGVMVIMTSNQDIKLSIEGHADRIGSAEYNQKLSERRAEAVKEFLIEHGVDGNRIHTSGHGQENTVNCGKLRGRELIDCLQPDRNVELRRE